MAFLKRLQIDIPFDGPMKPSSLAKAACAWLICLVGSYCLAIAEDSLNVANKVKAGYLYNFAKFVEWPQECFPDQDSPILVAVLGKDPIATDIQSTLNGTAINGHRVEVRLFPEGAEVGECHLLFVCASERKRLSRILESQQTRHVLTVSDMERFNENGGMICLHREGVNIRFEINQEKAEMAGLKISSKLLQLAKSRK